MDTPRDIDIGMPTSQETKCAEEIRDFANNPLRASFCFSAENFALNRYWDALVIGGNHCLLE